MHTLQLHLLENQFTESVCVSVLSHFSWVQLFATLWTRVHQALLPMRFSRQEYWSGLPCPPPGDLPDPVSCVSCIAGSFLTAESPGKHYREYSVQLLSCVQLFVTPWTIARQASLSITIS